MILGIQFYTQGQYSENLTSDRAGLTALPYTVGKNAIQVQTGFSREVFEVYSAKWNYMDMHLRYGLLEKLELFGGIGNINAKGQIDTDPPREFRFNEQTYLLGLRVNLFEGKNAIPAVGAEARWSNNFSFEVLELVVLVRSEFGEKLALGGNVFYSIYDDLGGTLKAEYYPLQKLGIFGEGMITQINAFDAESNVNYQHSRLTGGLIFRINKNLLIDASVGETWSQNLFYASFFFDFGLAYRMDWRK
jgi:hypothetical protein